MVLSIPTGALPHSTVPVPDASPSPTALSCFVSGGNRPPSGPLLFRQPARSGPSLPTHSSSSHCLPSSSSSPARAMRAHIYTSCGCAEGRQSACFQTAAPCQQPLGVSKYCVVRHAVARWRMGTSTATPGSPRPLSRNVEAALSVIAFEFTPTRPVCPRATCAICGGSPESAEHRDGRDHADKRCCKLWAVLGQYTWARIRTVRHGHVST